MIKHVPPIPNKKHTQNTYATSETITQTSRQVKWQNVTIVVGVNDEKPFKLTFCNIYTVSGDHFAIRYPLKNDVIDFHWWPHTTLKQSEDLKEVPALK